MFFFYFFFQSRTFLGTEQGDKGVEEGFEFVSGSRGTVFAFGSVCFGLCERGKEARTQARRDGNDVLCERHPVIAGPRCRGGLVRVVPVGPGPA